MRVCKFLPVTPVPSTEAGKTTRTKLLYTNFCHSWKELNSKIGSLQKMELVYTTST